MKNMKILTLITLMLISVFTIQTASALVVYFRPPKMILYANQTGRAEGTFEIKNMNNVTITVDFVPIDDIADVTQIENSITLEPNETKNVDFVVELTESATYNGGIRATYSSETETGVVLDAEVKVIAGEIIESNFLTENLLYVLLVIGVIIIIIAIVYMRRK